MSFTDSQKAMLSHKLCADKIKTRNQGGKPVSYIEGWHAIAEANRIFGFDAWSRETIDLRCVSEREREIGKDKAPGWGVSYIARVRVTVGDLVREGCGTGHGIDRDLGQAHESALKEAETDAMKRALMTFGNPFGLALYDKEQNNVAAPVDESTKAYIAACELAISAATDAKELHDWWMSDTEKSNRRAVGLDQEEVARLKQLVLDKKETLKNQTKEAA